MKLAIILAIRNLIGAGLRTWLNVIVLSFAFVSIIWMKGLMVGWDRQAKTDMRQWEIGNGQYWHKGYDPYDPFTLAESHSIIPANMRKEIQNDELVPILIAQGTIFPEGRMQSVFLRGIPSAQKLLKLPTGKLDTLSDAIPAIIGSSMARNAHLKTGDRIMLRWRDNNGTFDAADIEIVEIFNTNVASIDVGQIWIDLKKLQEMMLLPDHATLFTISSFDESRTSVDDFNLKPPSELTAEVDEMIKTKSAGQSVFYIILLLLAMLAIFDTQVLSIFKRQKEIGTYVALGYTQKQVVGLFTVEGAMHAIMAAIVAAVYGVPFFIWQSKAGFKIPMDTAELGMAIAPIMYPVYSVSLILSTILIVTIVTTIVSYWPSRRIAKMNPTEALRGKIQ